MPAVVPGQQREALAQAGQHAEAEHVYFQDAQGLEVVLVPLDHRAVFHGGVLDRHQLVEPAAGHDEAADVLREVAREANQLAGQQESLLEPRLLGIEAQLADLLVGQALAAPAPDRAGERRNSVGR